MSSIEEEIKTIAKQAWEQESKFLADQPYLNGILAAYVRSKLVELGEEIKKSKQHQEEEAYVYEEMEFVEIKDIDAAVQRMIKPNEPK